MTVKNLCLRFLPLILTLAFAETPCFAQILERAPGKSTHTFDGSYSGPALSRVAFPIGGMGAGMFCLEGSGAIAQMSIRNKLEFFNEPPVFAALHIRGKRPVTRVLEGPVPDWKYFGRPDTANGSPGSLLGLPRFTEAVFDARFPFATVRLRDDEIPLEVSLTGWSPFIPGQADDSGLPVGAIEYEFHNASREKREMVFSFNAKNFISVGNGGDRIESFPGGFLLTQENTPLHPTPPANAGSFVAWLDEPGVVIDHCWYKGGTWSGWWDLALAWRNVDKGILFSNPPSSDSAPGASLFLPFTLGPGERRTIRLKFAWYFPSTDLSVGITESVSFGESPSTGKEPFLHPVSGFLGEGFATSFGSKGDESTGQIASPSFTIDKNWIHFLLGGGKMPERACLNLVVDDKIVRTQTGDNDEKLSWRAWDVRDLKGKKAHLTILDIATEPWGHVNVDHIVMTDFSLKQFRQQLKAGAGMKTDAKITLLADFEGGTWNGWKVEKPGEKTQECAPGAGSGGPGPPDKTKTPATYTPYYSRMFATARQAAEAWRSGYDRLRADSELFRDTFYDTTLPPEVIEAVAANLSILKSPTVLRQQDGRLWGWEGCLDDKGGCCYGSCTHVWNYAQAISHLFPALERSLRDTEYNESFSKGAVAFRANLPITPVASTIVAVDKQLGDVDVAVDGQLGGLMKVYREWRISGDEAWLRGIWPHARQTLDYIIEHKDPRRTGVPEECQHNTYDINYYGPNGHIGTFYLGALAAAIEIGRALGEDVTSYKTLLAKGRARLEGELYNGEFFIQKIMKTGLNENFPFEDVEANKNAYRAIAETINTEGPKYQYGEGCLSDGVLGVWMARMCGLSQDFIDDKKVKEHLRSLYRYNLVRDVNSHANPQRATYALGREGGLLLCTWPKGGEPLMPFPYRNEVWTGIEYQVAGHMIMSGMVKEGLDVVRLCRERYSGERRNPFNEYECGHWYARAMSSYGLLQALTGARYDAVDRTLFIDSRVGDFRAFMATTGGWGTVGLRHGKPFLEVRKGSIPVERVLVSGNQARLAEQ